MTWKYKAYQDTVCVVMRIAANRALSAAGSNTKVAQIIGIFLVIHGQADAQFSTPVTSLFHHFREGLAPTTLPIVFLQLEFLHLHHSLDDVLLTLPPTTLPVVQILNTPEKEQFDTWKYWKMSDKLSRRDNSIIFFSIMICLTFWHAVAHESIRTLVSLKYFFYDHLFECTLFPVIKKLTYRLPIFGIIANFLLYLLHLLDLLQLLLSCAVQRARSHFHELKRIGRLLGWRFKGRF